MTDTEYYRNEPSGTFDAHLFEASEIEQAGGGDGEKTDVPASSLCSKTTAYGPFHAHDAGDDADVCGSCRSVAESEEDDA